LLRLVRDEDLTYPIIGVAKSDWKLEQLKDRKTALIITAVRIGGYYDSLRYREKYNLGKVALE
jgi:hypothetical protein